jgi:hypothetical protein
MAKQAPTKDDAPLRLFKSDFLEWFTHISPVLVLVVFLPIIGFFLWRSARANQGLGWWHVLISFAIGLLVWPLVEYLLHRFVFHFSPENPSERMKRILFLMHGVHHAQPREKSRLVMPPVVSIPLAAITWRIISRPTICASASPPGSGTIFSGQTNKTLLGATSALGDPLCKFFGGSKYCSLRSQHHDPHCTDGL